MTAPSVGIERRVGQRFPYLLPLSLRQLGTSVEGVGFTQDLSSRGVFFFTDAPLKEGSEIELTLRMPSEITLGESMPVRCRGHILRIVRPPFSGDAAHGCSSGSAPGATHDPSGHHSNHASSHGEPKIGVAVRLEGYEYLPESEATARLPRVATLHGQREEGRPLVHFSPRPVLG